MERKMYAEMAALEKDHWWFLGRRSVVFDMLNRVPRSGKLLDVGLGTGFNTKLFREAGFTVSGIEPSKDAIAFVKEIIPDVEVIQDYFPSSKIADASFNVVAMTDVLEHLEDDSAALADVRRILLPGGYVLLTVPAFKFLWTAHDERAHHFRRYTRSELSSVIHRSGLTPVFISYYNFFLFPLVAGVRLITKAVRGSDSGNDFDKTPGFLNTILATVFGSERFLLRHFQLPFGVSLIALARKD